MYRHRLRPPGGNRLALTGHAGVTGAVSGLFTKALGALTLALRGRTTLTQLGYAVDTTSPVVPAWSTAPTFSIFEGVASTIPLPVTAPGYAITLAWVSPLPQPSWITLNGGLSPSISFSGAQLSTNDLPAITISATANGTTVNSPAGGSIAVDVYSASGMTFSYALETTGLIPLRNGAQYWNSAFTTIHGTLIEAFEGSHTNTVNNGLREYNPSSFPITLPNGLTIPAKSQIEVFPDNNASGTPSIISSYDNIYYHYIPAVDKLWIRGSQFSRATATWITGNLLPDYGPDYSQDPQTYPNGYPNAEDLGNKAFGTMATAIIRPLGALDTDPSSRNQYLNDYNPHNAWSADLNCGLRIGGGSGGASQNYNVAPIYFIAPSKNFSDTSGYVQPYVVWARTPPPPSTFGGNSCVTFAGRDGACFAGEYVYWVGGSWFDAIPKAVARNWFYRMKVTPHLTNRNLPLDSGEGRIEALSPAPYAESLTTLMHDPFSNTLVYVTTQGIAIFDLVSMTWSQLENSTWLSYRNNFMADPRDVPGGCLGDFVDRAGVSTKEVLRKYYWRPGASDKWMNDPGKDQTTNPALRTRSVHSLRVIRTPQDWAARSTAPGVMWAHDFSQSDDEVNLFDSFGGWYGTNPDPATVPNVNKRVYDAASGMWAMRTTCVGATLTQTAPLGAKGDSHVIHVTNVSSFPDPAATLPYAVFIGLPGSGTIPYEQATVTARNVGAGTLTITRKVDGNNYPGQVAGVTYAATDAPPYPTGWSVGMNPGITWKRPFMALPAGQNGKAQPDVGLTNGAARNTNYTWETTRNNSQHYLVRKGYFGSRYYWDTTVNPSAPMASGWTDAEGYVTTGTNIFEGDEFYLQFRVRVGAGIVTEQQSSKFFYLHSLVGGGQGQLFGEMGPAGSVVPPASERINGVTYGGLPFLFTGGGDGRAPAGGYLASDMLVDGYNGGNNRPWQYDYPANFTNQSAGSFCWPADTWVTFLLHIKFGRDNAEAYAPAGISAFSTQMDPPFRNATDPSFNTTVEWKVHLPGWSDYKVLFRSTTLPWFFSNEIGTPGWWRYDPPGINAIWLTPFPNLYQNSGGKPPLTNTTPVDFTQVIFSKKPIACPSDASVQPTSYTTEFALTEAAISEGGRWVNGKVTGLLWNNVKTVNDAAFGSAFYGTTGNNYDDDIAVLSTPTFTANQYAQATVSRAVGYSPGVSHEVELLLRFSITANDAHGYEVLWGQAGNIAIVRWNGPIGNYTPSTTVNGLNIGAAVDGDILKAQIVGNILTVFKNGAQVASVDVTTNFGGGTVWSSGQPGIGFWPQTGATLTSYGWKNFTAGNL